MASSLFENHQSRPAATATGTDSLRGMAQMFKAASNPQAFVQNMLQSNPNSAAVIQLINSSGGNPKAAFYELARQKGIDPESFLKLLQ